MPACSVVREARGDAAIYTVAGRFEGGCAWDLSRRLAAEKLPEVVVDFSRCHLFQDHGIAVIAQALVAREGGRVVLRGLRQHQERLFKYFGVDVAKLSQRAQAPAAPPFAAPALIREVG